MLTLTSVTIWLRWEQAGSGGSSVLNGPYGLSHRLRNDIICAVECMKSWEKAGIMELSEVRKLEEMLRALERQPDVV